MSKPLMPNPQGLPPGPGLLRPRSLGGGEASPIPQQPIKPIPSSPAQHPPSTGGNVGILGSPLSGSDSGGGLLSSSIPSSVNLTSNVINDNNLDAQKENDTSYRSLGELTSEQLLAASPGEFDYLDDVVMNITKTIQDQLTNMGKTDDITKAKAERGKKLYYDMMKQLDSMILKELSNQTRAQLQEDRKIITAMVINEIMGLGPLEPLWKDTRITEIIVDGPKSIIVEIGGKLHRVPGATFRDKEHLLGLCQQILANINKRIDPSNPKEDGRLPDKSRINVVHQHIAPDGPLLTIRRHRDEVWTVKELVERGSFTEDILVDLAFWIYGGCSTLVLGGTGSGKTTVLNAISGLIPPDARIVTIEDNLELQLHPDRFVAAMEAKPAGANGKGAVSIRELVKNSLRMRPDRIVVGEVRDAAAFDMLQAMNTGHNGSMTTFHANGADEAIDRLSSLVMQAGELEPSGVLSLIGGAVDLLIVVERYPEDGSRRVSGVYEIPSRVTVVDGKQSLEPIPLWQFIHDSTDPETNRVIGHYEKVNEPSDVLIKKHRLHRQTPKTPEQIYEMSRVH